MVHRFGLIYDISTFSETLGNIRRGGSKEEISSYRQMVLFQRKLESIAERHSLQFEKFLGDGAFYTTRRALRLVRAAVEIQRFYSEMKRKGFAFNKGLRIALNYGYYRLLPMKTVERVERADHRVLRSRHRRAVAPHDRQGEQRDRGDRRVPRLARLRPLRTCTSFFAPLARGVDVVDHTSTRASSTRTSTQNNNLINEGIVASMTLLQELSTELTNESSRCSGSSASGGPTSASRPRSPGSNTSASGSSAWCS